VFVYPKPVVAASRGHALAGGFMLFCAADVRLAVDEPRSQYGLTEVAAGVPGIGPTAAIVAAAVPAHEQAAILLPGRRLTAREAAALGIVHALEPDATGLDAHALERARALAGAVEPAAYRVSKLALRGPLVDDAARVAKRLAPLVPRGNVLARRG